MKLPALVCSTILLAGCADPGPSSEPMTEAFDERNDIAGQKTQQVETGDVHWLRDPEQAKQLSKKTGKPILMLFQEIPG